MKVAIANAFLPSEELSGVPWQVHHLANSLCRLGHAVTVFSFSPRPDSARYELHQYPRPRLPRRFFPFAMAYWLARTDFARFDVVNPHGDNYLLSTSCPVVRTFHGSAVDELRAAKTPQRKLFFLVTAFLERVGAARADHVVGVSEATRARIRAVQTIIPCGVDTEVFGPGEKSENPSVLFVGTESGRKRGSWLADRFKTEVKPLVPDAELRMVTEALGDEPGIRRYGRVPFAQLVELYRSSWVFCLPSTYEGFGVPYVEAMASSTAVVATRPNAGASEVLADGRYGVLVDDRGLPEALARVLRDASLRRAYEMRGIQQSRTYAWPQVAARYEAIFEKAIAEERPRRRTAT